MDIPTYAPVAINRWTLNQALGADIRGRPGSASHHPAVCECLVCADGRVALGMRPLTPLFRRRAVPSFYRRRWRR